MKLILIKIGKAAKTLRREGLARGIQRISVALWRFLVAYFGKVKSADILFVSGGIAGDSALYRTVHYSEELRNQGFSCSVTVQDNRNLLEYANKFKIFILHRVLFNEKIAEFIEKIKENGGEIIFETDDLVFDPKYLHELDFYKNLNFLEKKLYENGVGGEILRDLYVKVATTTTSYLAKKLESYGKKVFIVKNKLSQSDVEIANKIFESKVKSQKSKVKLGYFSGTFSHNKDFAVITDVLLEVMEKHQDVELFLVGPLDVENRLNKFKERIKQLPRVSRKKHFENISKVDINLSPLEMENPFCESKSELKFFEAGIVGVPTVASGTQTFKEAISDGVNGFVASNTDEWKNKLEELILSPERRSKMGQEARKKALEEYSTQNAKNDEFYAFLMSKL